jgi:hypothetical protein
MESLLRCTVTPGQFSDEYAISGGDFSLFAPKDSVELDREPSRDDPVEGWLRVEVVEPANGEGKVVVRLPSEAIEAGYFVIVGSDRLKSVGGPRHTPS